MPEHLEYCYICGSSYGASDAEGGGGLLCSCMAIEAATNNPSQQSTSGSSSSSANKKFAYNDIDLIFGMELSTTKQFDRVKTAG